MLEEDHSDIKVVAAAQRDVWFRKLHVDYWCPKCGRFHRPYSAIGKRHHAAAKAEQLEALRTRKDKVR